MLLPESIGDKFIDVSGRLNLLGNRPPLLRPPFAPEAAYLESLRQINPSDLEKNNSVEELSRYEYGYALLAHGARANPKDVKRVEAELGKFISRNRTFWSQRRIALAKGVLSSIQDHLAIPDEAKISLEDLAFRFYEDIEKDERVANVHTRTGIIGFDYLKLANERLDISFPPVFTHELMHFFGRRILRSDNKPYRSGIRIVGSPEWNFRLLNEGLVSHFTIAHLLKNFPELYPKDPTGYTQDTDKKRIKRLFQEPAIEYHQSRTNIELIIDKIDRSGIGDGLTLAQSAHFGTGLLELRRVLNTLFANLGGFNEFARRALIIEQNTNYRKVPELSQHLLDLIAAA